MVLKTVAMKVDMMVECLAVSLVSKTVELMVVLKVA